MLSQWVSLAHLPLNTPLKGDGGADRPTEMCPLVINETITYVDRGHVSQTYARELAQPFRTAFRTELFR